ncbi:hypothetical protein B0H13DRAFT_1935558, partial [Mycena leptocephala]
MPKAAKTPVKARPKPKPVRTPKRKSAPIIDDKAEESCVIISVRGRPLIFGIRDDGVLVETKPTPVRTRNKKSAPIIDDEAEESDDGVLVEHPNQEEADSPNAAGSADNNEYEEDFINDRDPYEGGEDHTLRSASPDITPPPSQFKKPGLVYMIPHDSLDVPSPSKRKRRAASADSVETPLRSKRKSIAATGDSLDTPSPSKHKMQPIETNDVIEVESTSDEDLEAMDEDDSMFKRSTGLKAIALPPLLTTRRAPPFIVDGKMSLESTTVPSPHRSVTPGRVDHDQLALEDGIRMSIEDSRSSSHARLPVRYSPDWEPLSVTDLIEEAAAKAVQIILLVPRTPATPIKKSKTASTRKGKERARSPSTNVDLEDAPVVPSKIISHSETAKHRTAVPNTVVKKSVRYPLVTNGGDANISTFMTPLAPPSASALSSASKGGALLTMAQMRRLARGEPIGEEEPEEDPTPPIMPDQVFLEDLESYKAHFDPSTPCGVFDLELQD